MSLQVWLPLNGDLKNKGVANANIGSIITAQGSFISGGKIGQGLKTGTSNSISTEYTPDCTKDLTLCGWFKFNKAEIAAVLESKTYSSTASNATGNLIGNSSYGGIGLCWNGNAMNTTKVFTTLGIFASIRGNSNLYTAGSINVDFDKWYHLMLIWDSTNKILNFYVNGAKYKTANVTNAGTVRNYPININYSGIYGGNGPSANIPFVTNDIRIYDHCLSQVEIKEISRGLVRHYKLSSLLCGSNPNLLTGTNPETDGIGTLVSHDGGAYVVSNEVKFNGHPTIKITPSSSSINTGAKNYYGAGNGIALTNNTTYTYSCWIYSTVADTFGFSSLGHYQTLVSNSSPHNSTRSHEGDSIPANKWTHVSITFTTTAACYFRSFWIYFANTSQIIYIAQPKLELGSVATPWIPNSTDPLYITLGLDSTEEVDCSGIGSSGIKSGTFGSSLDSPRYGSALLFTDTSTYMVSTIDYASGIYTFSWWGKFTNYTSTMMWGYGNGNRLNLFLTGGKIYLNIGDGTTNPIQNNGTDISIIPYANNQWHHFVLTSDGTSSKLYIDGTLAGTAKTFRPITGSTVYFNGWDTTTSYKFNGYLSDFRLYATALSETDIQALYKAGAKIDDKGNFYTAEIVENEEDRVKISLKNASASGNSIGANLIPSSSMVEHTGTYPTSANLVNYYIQPADINLTESTYVLSFWAKSTVDGDKIYCYFYSPNTTTSVLTNQNYSADYTDGMAIFTLSTQWERYWVKYTQSTTDARKYVICPRLFKQGTGYSSGTGTVSFKGIKLEEGSIPTPWVPSSGYTNAEVGFSETETSKGKIYTDSIEANKIYEF